MNVLIIEDDKGLVDLVTEKVEQCGCYCNSAHSAEDAYRRLQEQMPHLMILDYSLPDMNGDEFISMLKKREHVVPPFIVCTGLGDEHVAVAMMRLGARDYLIKNNYFLERLPDVVQRVGRELENENQRTRAEEALQASEELYRKLISSIPDMIIRTDLEGNIIFVNETVFPSLGYRTNDRMPGKNMLTFIADKDRARGSQNVKRMMDCYIGPQEYTIEGDDGKSIECEINGDVLRHNNGTPFGMVFTVRDLTEKKKLQAQLLQAQKMEAIGRLAGGVAHDHNNMLGVILGYAALLEQELPPTSPAQRKIKTIIAAAERSANLTKQLLAFSRKQVIAPVVVNLNEELTSLNKMWSRLIGEDVMVDVVFQEDLWNVRIDPTQFSQIVTNLATNARDAMVNTGTITIKTKNDVVEKPLATVLGDIAPGDYVAFSFGDSGCGMDAPTLTQIFDPFFTTKSKDKGTGLGLATVFGIVAQNNGAISVDSRVGEGTTFTIRFPRHAGEQAAPMEISVDDALSGTETILVVEDEEDLLELAKSTLEAQGYTVLCALTPLTALTICESYAGKIDLLVTDVVLPGLNGKELRERLEPQRPSLRTLFVSGYSSDILASRGVSEEEIHFLSKPFLPTTLLKKVRQVLK